MYRKHKKKLWGWGMLSFFPEVNTYHSILITVVGQVDYTGPLSPFDTVLYGYGLRTTPFLIL